MAEKESLIKLKLKLEKELDEHYKSNARKELEQFYSNIITAIVCLTAGIGLGYIIGSGIL